jgi:hypothetical protein
MPLRLEVFHPDRILVGVATGEVTLPEFRDFLVEVVKSGILHYRKIIDATRATSAVIGKDELLAMDAMFRSATGGAERARGPIAVVVDPERGELARAFKELALKDRPVEIFRSIYEARRWVMAQPTRDL